MAGEIHIFTLNIPLPLNISYHWVIYVLISSPTIIPSKIKPNFTSLSIVEPIHPKLSTKQIEKNNSSNKQVWSFNTNWNPLLYFIIPTNELNYDCFIVRSKLNEIRGLVWGFTFYWLVKLYILVARCYRVRQNKRVKRGD